MSIHCTPRECPFMSRIHDIDSCLEFVWETITPYLFTWLNFLRYGTKRIIQHLPGILPNRHSARPCRYDTSENFSIGSTDAFIKVVKMLSIVICQNRFLLVKNRHYIINIIYLYIVSKMTNPILILTNDNWQDLTISVFTSVSFLNKSVLLIFCFSVFYHPCGLCWLSRQRAADALHHRPAPSPLSLNKGVFFGGKGWIFGEKMVFLRAENE